MRVFENGFELVFRFLVRLLSCVASSFFVCWLILEWDSNDEIGLRTPLIGPHWNHNNLQETNSIRNAVWLVRSLFPFSRDYWLWRGCHNPWCAFSLNDSILMQRVNGEQNSKRQSSESRPLVIDFLRQKYSNKSDSDEPNASDCSFIASRCDSKDGYHSNRWKQFSTASIISNLFRLTWLLTHDSISRFRWRSTDKIHKGVEKSLFT